MGLEREHRLDTELNRLLDELSRPERDPHTDAPGKRTQVHQLVEQLTAQHRSEHAATPGRASLVERLVQMASPLQLEDFRVVALRDVLAAIGDRRQLRDATLASADRDVARRAIPAGRSAPGEADAEGQAMWRASERHAATLYRHAFDAGEVSQDDPDVQAALARAGSGAPLPAAVRRRMEDELGAPLDRVRVHSDPVAASAARALHAEAFTVGEDIFFADGSYAPDSRAGQKLLAHELTHVVQSWQGRSDAAGGRRVSQPGDSLEREADAVAEQVSDRIDRRGGAIGVDGRGGAGEAGRGAGGLDRPATASADGARGAAPQPRAAATAASAV
ncbi:MAG TPA: DUF4157 domain-containing protein, partial [Kofleriaceae bacterium]|nr:DUF4157 domain-containing protein [Kofleriaceae bacterium]